MEVSILSHFTNSALVVYGLKWLRGTKRYQRFAKWIPCENAIVHRAMSFIGASATAIGMHGAVEGTHLAGWKLTLLIPPVWVMLHTLWDIAQQMALNQFIFAVAVQEKAAAPVVTTPIAQDVTVTTALTKG